MRKTGKLLTVRRYEGALLTSLRIADAAICVGAGLVAFFVRFGLRGLPDAYQAALAVATLLVLVLFPLLRVYETYRTRSLIAPSARTVIAWLVTMAILLALSVMVHRGARFSRLWLAEWVGFGVIGFVILRLSAYFCLRFLRTSGRNLKKVALIGGGPIGLELRRRAARERWMGFKIVEHYREMSGNPQPEGTGCPASKSLIERLEAREIDEIWITPTLAQVGLVKRICALSKNYATTVRYAPDLSELFLLNHGITEIAGLPMIDLTASPLQGVDGLLKRFEDIVLAGAALIVALPLMLVIALCVRLTSRGPVIFKQLRHGWDGDEIKVYKFRTMQAHAKEDGVTQASKNDPRVTALGRFLRRTSLDELPQLVNVLQGRMSLVGPRPHACEHNDLYQTRIEGYMLRHKMRPGITGWAQINGFRGETDTLDKMQNRVNYDLFYIEHWSLWLDVKIIFLTLVRGFVNPNAY